ncbi:MULTISPECIES: tRNA (adenosine(37)-N6)-dimethylallyltransferase MiaA [Planktothricoides]|uniref:tRNA dimethylallyltransferase n=1 Tax=Planktothricoides raciborskii FACHB-1370 TaxID=2949576 RepID=A0ABR8EIF0_9CYAN|nr:MULTISPECIES: tRNA (adenosine(37)-N6)-dimethylallyltransferase MiaA [Planktothricoides]KOR36875.1 tRNA delta(2)-isopentenylpyrophosphate transferase [Planktothricoides sp. SR001]MBD2546340.1 tRNA (adenosine(37)-N6)-dimethylallyltransferase MiaA [Planktothricoides raciborskii FACHB-1370]MBD2584677.1 tRNA (adenosine(37)-N6)-dimethylallyltransferase MiaA [Planktothricoides raciborskii FACHB-1261]
MGGLIVICGATATGKSGLAIAIAHRLHSIIISADSRQVYRDFDIGTAKPTREEQQQVPHYLIDICDPTETLTVADYQQQAQSLIASTPYTPPPLLVGGTGLYIKSVVRGMKIPRVPPHPELRSQLADLGQSQCYSMLQQVDPLAAAKIHGNDSVRTLRALEVYYVTGCPISQQQGENPPGYPILQIGLDCETQALSDSASAPLRDGASAPLRERISRRTQLMISAGFVAEVEYLCEKYGRDLPLLNTLGYAEIKDYLAGKISLEEAIGLTILHTRQFAKRQRTWFQRDADIEWFNADDLDLVEQVWQRIQEFIEKLS